MLLAPAGSRPTWQVETASLGWNKREWPRNAAGNVLFPTMPTAIELRGQPCCRSKPTGCRLVASAEDNIIAVAMASGAGRGQIAGAATGEGIRMRSKKRECRAKRATCARITGPGVVRKPCDRRTVQVETHV